MRVKIPTIHANHIGLKAMIVLEDGSTYRGIGFGYPKTVGGEFVFNTGMVGYTETLTDPSYRGQILCLTYPLIGNYGVPSNSIKDGYGLPKYFESNSIQVSGLIVHEISSVANHRECDKTLDQWLYEEKIPGISGIDTRDLTKKIRIKGVMKGALAVSENEINSKELLNTIKKTKYDGFNFMSQVSIGTTVEYGDPTLEPIVLIDTGTKYSIIRNILTMGYKVIRVPWDTSFSKIISYKPKGIIISNGPGDPKMCNSTIETVVKLFESTLPILGICLGNQIIALAAGGDTYKLKFGHRGQNKGCTDLDTNQTFITSQNHGYGVKSNTLNKTGFKAWYINSDDETIEGIKHETKPIIAVQFHPEASPGPYDCMHVFEEFKHLVEQDRSDEKSIQSDRVNGGGKIFQKMKQ
ncbi:MAG TPA: glutamine-hydrolyzing carbamoyl-phosphate synthase small subunit [Nitrososphaeraceae archaeon]|jgi:carbamoyl-phosphate synthase small subunit|nr:glutamine-hydrolyzing carbamoyl-phosphate synthase small subunit [Nitrososphaeraceae archaeon]